MVEELGGLGEHETLAFAEATYTPGSILGDRYRIRSLLGRGGMGEVWRAFDLKLRVDVALKALRTEWLANDAALEALRREVRSAREVVSPNVCRVFDLVELEGQELVSMEYIDGITLWDILRARAPLELTEAREIALQFLAGLEAIHAAGLVHRDIKPENLMMTRSGRVVVMDFGIAKGLAEGRSDTISGTPAYMAPEQARGEPVTSRADVFSAGVVLAEMVAPGGLRSFEDRQRLWRAVHSQPPEVSDTQWAPVLARALAPIAEERYATAAALSRALEEVTLRVADAEAARPYPGLASFTEEEAEYFFGRELEVEEMWKKLQRPHLLGLIGPSGAGKSSFLRAGLLPVMPTGWRAVVVAPGAQPFTTLAQALVPELEGDTEAMRDLLRFEEPGVAVDLVRRWREAHDEVLLIVDQFEELFTQNPPEVQTRFAELLAALALEADAHVLLSMRDDFLFHCSSQPALTPMFSELTPLRPPLGSALRRALVQPALKCGYRFEDESLVEEMVGEVTSERGALPLLAFAAARLWELRDREKGLLTREAYERIGGVGGALAQHAEATLERIGHDELPVVREIFRNLVTSQGTRAARDRAELLSVFQESGSAGAVARRTGRGKVFLSYSREDAKRAKRLARMLERRGFQVWWDRRIAPGESFDKAIEGALREAAAVVVLWSNHSVESNWVKAEASEALARGVLVPVLLERVAPPLEFRRLEAAELDDADSSGEELEQLCRVLGGLVERSVPVGAPGGGTHFSAERVLDALVDARLLTTYEEPAEDDEGEPRQRLEIIHESLRSNWPRLVRWRTQDADSAQLRDQLRQVARLWVERGRPEDLLWTGTSFKEFELWKERYEGGLSDTEGEFAAAMTRRAERRKRRRRMITAAVVAVALGVAAATSLLWQRSEVERAKALLAEQAAREEALRAEAQKLLALGQLELEKWPTVALAYATKSLELADTPEARVFAVRALAAGPPATVLYEGEIEGLLSGVAFSPDGAWAAVWGFNVIQVVSRDGQTRRALGTFPPGVAAAFDPGGRYLFGAGGGELHVWSVPGFELVERQVLPEGRLNQLHATPAGVFSLTVVEDEQTLMRHAVGTAPRLIGRFTSRRLGNSNVQNLDIDPAGRWLAFASDTDLYLRSLDDWSAAPRRIARQSERIRNVDFLPDGESVATVDGERTRIWSTRPGREGEPLRTIPERMYPAFAPARSLLAGWGRTNKGLLAEFWDLEASPDVSATPFSVVLPGADQALNSATFDPRGDWLVTGSLGAIGFWPVPRALPRLLGSAQARQPVSDLVFVADDQLAERWRGGGGKIVLWDLGPEGGHRELAEAPVQFGSLALDRNGRRLVAAQFGGALLVPLDGGPPRALEGFEEAWVQAAAVDVEGRLVAAAGAFGKRTDKVIRIWDLETNDTWTLGPAEDAGEGWNGRISDLMFLPTGELLSVGHGGLRLWSPREGTYATVAETADASRLEVFGGRYAVYDVETPFGWGVEIADLESGERRRVPSHGDWVWPLAVDSRGEILVTGGGDGIVRVGPIDGGEPHLLFGHQGGINAVAVSPDGRWVASGGEESTVRLWPMPDISQPPFHTLPYEDLLGKLRSLTNFRVVEDSESSTGWNLKSDPFPGWEEVPTW